MHEWIIQDKVNWGIKEFFEGKSFITQAQMLLNSQKGFSKSNGIKM